MQVSDIRKPHNFGHMYTSFLCQTELCSIRWNFRVPEKTCKCKKARHALKKPAKVSATVSWVCVIAITEDVLVKIKVRHEMWDQRMHLLLVAECQEWNQAHQSLQNAGISTNKWAIDTIKQHYQLLFVTAKLWEFLHKTQHSLIVTAADTIGFLRRTHNMSMYTRASVVLSTCLPSNDLK